MKKKEFEKSKSISLCPNCGSSNQQMSGLSTPPYGPAKYRCPDCGYEGTFVEVDKSEVSKFISNLRKRSKKK